MRNGRQVAMVVVATGVLANVVWWRGSIHAAASGEVEPPMRLVDTGLYGAGNPHGLRVDPSNRPFSPQYPLWSDGAIKRRWVSLPDGAAIDARDVDAWSFPVGTKFWKEFSFAGRKVETRFLWKVSPARWAFASYVWNAGGTEAVKAPASGVVNAAEAAPGRFHSIPSVDECRACHDSGRTEILGFNVLQLSTDRDPNAIHGESLNPDMMSLATLHAEGRLQPARPEVVANPPRIDARTPEERAVLGYLAANCGTCHHRAGELAPLGLTWRHSELRANGSAIAHAMASQATKWQVPGIPEGQSVLINADRPEDGALLRRMRSRKPSSQMPPLGTSLSDREALEAVTRWIVSHPATPTRQTAQ